jgi:hypothetical protein
VLAILQMQVAWRYDYDPSEVAVAAAAQLRTLGQPARSSARRAYYVPSFVGLGGAGGALCCFLSEFGKKSDRYGCVGSTWRDNEG